MKKRRIPTILACVIFIVGLSLLLYPLCSNLWNERRHDQLISAYTQQVAQIPQEDYSAWFQGAEAYNETLIGTVPPDAFAFSTEEEDAEYMAQLDFREDGVMGYVKIPRISVSLPIYHTTSQEALQKGVGHLQGSSLPIGGEGTHCVLSAHRGLPSATLFTDLDLLAEGDHFYLYVLDRILAYEVDQILEVEPTQTTELAVVEGEDYVTLLTCTPYGVNTHRLLVRGHRIEYVAEMEAAEEAEPSLSSLHTHYGLWAGGGLAATLLCILLMYRHRRAGRGGKRLAQRGGRQSRRYRGRRVSSEGVAQVRQPEKKRKRRTAKRGSPVRTVAAALLFAVGLCVLLYPAVSDLWNQHRQNSLISQYTKMVSQLSEEDYSAYRAAAEAYNKTLRNDLHDAFSSADPGEDDPYWSLLDLDGSGVMGYIEIPQISVRLAIYHGTGETALQHGVGHLTGTSLPVGGASTHCVLSGHRGLPSALLFTDLDQLQRGDVFFLHVLGETLAYEVDQILVVEPDEVSALALEEGRDYVTLVTCTPYGVNTHRLLVRGRRVPLEETEQQEISTAQQVIRSFGWQGKLALALLACIILVFILLAARRGKRMKKKGSAVPR